MAEVDGVIFRRRYAESACMAVSCCIGVKIKAKMLCADLGSRIGSSRRRYRCTQGQPGYPEGSTRAVSAGLSCIVAGIRRSGQRGRMKTDTGRCVSLLAPGEKCTRLIVMSAFPPLVPCKHGRFDYRWLQPGACAVVAKEAAMMKTFRAFLYGVMILVTALVPPIISLIHQFRS